MNKKIILTLAVAAVAGLVMARPGPGGFHHGGFHHGGAIDGTAEDIRLELHEEAVDAGAAVHKNGLSGDVFRHIARQKKRGVRDVLHLGTDAPVYSRPHHLLLHLADLSLKVFHLLMLGEPSDEACSSNSRQQEACTCRYDMLPIHVVG